MSDNDHRLMLDGPEHEYFSMDCPCCAAKDAQLKTARAALERIRARIGGVMTTGYSALLPVIVEIRRIVRDALKELPEGGEKGGE
jgi:hypothetical protein